MEVSRLESILNLLRNQERVRQAHLHWNMPRGILEDLERPRSNVCYSNVLAFSRLAVSRANLRLTFGAHILLVFVFFPSMDPEDVQQQSSVQTKPTLESLKPNLSRFAAQMLEF